LLSKHRQNVIYSIYTTLPTILAAIHLRTRLRRTRRSDADARTGAVVIRTPGVKAELYGWVRIGTEKYGAAGLFARQPPPHKATAGQAIGLMGKACLPNWRKISPISPIKNTPATDSPMHYPAPNTGGDPPPHKAPADKAKRCRRPTSTFARGYGGQASRGSNAPTSQLAANEVMPPPDISRGSTVLLRWRPSHYSITRPPS